MKNSCHNVALNIQHMESGFASFKHSLAIPQPPSTPQQVDMEKKKREKLYGVGCRVKYVVDTPEKIWGCLDEHMYLEGAQRYFRAHKVQMLLTESEAKGETLSHFPLLVHQWSLVEALRAQISQRSRDRLLESGLDAKQYAVALAAVAVIDELNLTQIVLFFFESSGHDSSCSYSTGHNNSHSSKHGGIHGKGRKLNLDDFLQRYGLFEDETKAIIFVVNKRITPDDEKLMELAVESRKFFCMVCTHADNLVQMELAVESRKFFCMVCTYANNLVQVVDRASQKLQLDQLEEQLRKDLSLVQSLNVRIFIVCIPCPEGQLTVSPDLTMVSENIRKLQFPLLQAYLSQPRGLLDKLQIHSFVKEEVCDAMEPFVNVKKRHQALDFSQHLVAGTLIPIAGPVMVSFLKTMRYTLKACSEVGLIEDADDAMNKVSEDVNKHRFSAKISSKEGMITAVHDSLIHIFGAVVFEIAIAEVVSTAAEAALHGALPLVGPAISAAHLPGRFKKIGEKLASKACMLHELWIMQNITGLLGKTVG